MGRRDVHSPVQIGDRPGNLEDSNIGPGTQTKPINSGFQKPLALLINRTELLDVAIGHLTVAIDLVTLESVQLDLSGPVDPSADPS
jgi:hypothetical protein